MKSNAVWKDNILKDAPKGEMILEKKQKQKPIPPFWGGNGLHRVIFRCA
jgi:hypothetical protein